MHILNELMHAFLLHIYLEVGALAYSAHICSAVPYSAKQLSKVVFLICAPPPHQSRRVTLDPRL